MPKMKSKSAAMKRFRVCGSGRVKHARAFKRHILTKKSSKAKRQLRGMTGLHASHRDAVRAMLPGVC